MTVAAPARVGFHSLPGDLIVEILNFLDQPTGLSLSAKTTSKDFYHHFPKPRHLHFTTVNVDILGSAALACQYLRRYHNSICSVNALHILPTDQHMFELLGMSLKVLKLNANGLDKSGFNTLMALKVEDLTLMCNDLEPYWHLISRKPLRSLKLLVGEISLIGLKHLEKTPVEKLSIRSGEHIFYQFPKEAFPLLRKIALKELELGFSRQLPDDEKLKQLVECRMEKLSFRFYGHLMPWHIEVFSKNVKKLAQDMPTLKKVELNGKLL
jgi:hypothetical protein